MGVRHRRVVISEENPWNYSCGYCRTVFMGAAADKAGTEWFSRNHLSRCGGWLRWKGSH